MFHREGAALMVAAAFTVALASCTKQADARMARAGNADAGVSPYGALNLVSPAEEQFFAGRAEEGEALLAKAKASSRKAAEQPAPQAERTQQAEPAGRQADYEKLSAVLSAMSPRFRAVVRLDDRDAFLADLEAVLAEEQNFRADDLSLYYLIDKKHSVGADYVPKDLKPVRKTELFNVSRNDLSLRPDVYDALCAMARGAQQDGITLMVSSTYRSYEYQENLFARYVRQDGEALAERYSARAGTSQHQLGVAVDFGSVTDEFAGTRQGRWLAEHCEEYGWSLSFPKEYEDVTGFMWECWHFRYIGIPACALQKRWFGDVQQFMFEFIDAWKKA